MFARVQPAIKGNPRKRQKISHSPESEASDTAGPATMATPSSIPTTAPAVKDGPKAACEHEQTLKRLEPDLEAMRQLITCKVCQRFLSEPYSLTCGHTYCYECLDAWLVDQKKRTCPGCRAVINQQPTPSYVIREMTLIFTSRAELMPEGETLEEHEEFAREAAEKVARDRDNTEARHGGLFKGTFNGKYGARTMPIRDPGDNVDRCPDCHWELEHGVCSGCGLEIGDMDDGFSDTDESSLSEGDSELDHELMREIGEQDDGTFANVFGEEPGSLNDDDFIDEEGNLRPDDGAHDIDHVFGGFRDLGQASQQVFWGGGEDTDGLDSDEDSEEMDSFINDEAEEGASDEEDEDEEEEVPHGPRRPRHRTPFLHDSDDEEEEDAADDGPPLVQIDSEDDEEDDEGPVATGGQRTKASRSTRRRQAAAYSSEEDESGSGIGSESDSGGDSESGSESGSDSSDSSATQPGIQDLFATSGAAQEPGAFSPLQEDGTSESGDDIHHHYEDHDDDDNEQDEDDEHHEDEDNDYGGADLGGYGDYNGYDIEVPRAETPEDERPAPASLTHRLLSRQRRTARHAERVSAHRAESPTRGSGLGHPFQLGDTLVRINERQRRMGSE